MTIKETEVQPTLLRAHDLINGQRQEDYGPPVKNFQAIADVWNVLLDGRLKSPITPEDVCGLMAGLKLVRAAKDGWTHEDSIIDGAGYLGLIERVR